MGKPVGGRGHKADYKTTHVRIPETIKPLVDSLSNDYRQYVSEANCLDFENKGLLPKVPAIYFVLEDEEIVYIGQTKNLVSRWRGHHIAASLANLTGKISIAWLQCDNTKLLKVLEDTLLATVQPRLNHPTQGRFTEKFVGEEKKLRSVRLTDTAWDKLHSIGDSLSVTRTDAIELMARWGIPDEKQIILDAIDRYIESQLARSGGNQFKKKGEIQDIENKRDWTHLLKFKKEIEGER